MSKLRKEELSKIMEFTWKELDDYIKTERFNLEFTFNKTVEDNEDFFEEGMKVLYMKYEDLNDSEVAKLYFDQRPFLTYNLLLASTNYYDYGGAPRLHGYAAGFNDSSYIYINPQDKIKLIVSDIVCYENIDYQTNPALIQHYT